MVEAKERALDVRSDSSALSVVSARLGSVSWGMD